MLAMVVNEDAFILDVRGVFEVIASMLAPTEGRGHPYQTTQPQGRAVARLALLILLLLLLLIHPPLRKAEWRRSSGDWRAAPFDAVEHIACRCQRSQPEGDAPG